MGKAVKLFIISDVHLRSKNCQAELLLETIRKYDFQTLLIVGDLIEENRGDSKNIKMNWHQFLVIEHLRRILSKKNGNKEIVRIVGNHDPSGNDFINQILGIKTVKEYRWEINDRRYGAIHGHQFDNYILRNRVLGKFISTKLLLMQKFDTKKRYLSRFVQNFHNRWLKLSERVAYGAKKYALKEKIDVIICGHTHKAIKHVMSDTNQKVEYWNCGDWTGSKCSFITVDYNGTLELIELDSGY